MCPVHAAVRVDGPGDGVVRLDQAIENLPFDQHIAVQEKNMGELLILQKLRGHVVSRHFDICAVKDKMLVAPSCGMECLRRGDQAVGICRRHDVRGSRCCDQDIHTIFPSSKGLSQNRAMPRRCGDRARAFGWVDARGTASGEPICESEHEPDQAACEHHTRDHRGDTIVVRDLQIFFAIFTVHMYLS